MTTPPHLIPGCDEGGVVCAGGDGPCLTLKLPVLVELQATVHTSCTCERGEEHYIMSIELQGNTRDDIGQQRRGGNKGEEKVFGTHASIF